MHLFSNLPFSVRGLKGLRVVDASIIPAAMSGNTYATQVRIKVQSRFGSTLYSLFCQSI